MNIRFCADIIPRIAHDGHIPGQSGQDVLRILVKIFSNHVRMCIRDSMKENAEFMRFLPWDLFHCIGVKTITSGSHKLFQHSRPEGPSSDLSRLQRWQKLVTELNENPIELTRFTYDRMYILEKLAQGRRGLPEVTAQIQVIDENTPIYLAALGPFGHYYQRRCVLAAQAAEKHLRANHRGLELVFTVTTAGVPNLVNGITIRPLYNQYTPNAVAQINNVLARGDFSALDDFKEPLPPPLEPRPEDNPDP